MALAVVRVALVPGSARKVRELLRRTAPVELDEVGLKRQLTFQAGDEVLLLLEGDNAERAAQSLVAGRSSRLEESELAPYLAGAPRVLGESSPGADRTPPDGVSFSALPGPGNSDGGSGDV